MQKDYLSGKTCWCGKVKVLLKTSLSLLPPLYFQNNKKQTKKHKYHMVMYSHGEQIFLCEFQVIIITEPPQYSPRSLVTTSLYEEGVQEQEAWEQRTQISFLDFLKELIYRQALKKDS